MFDPTAQQLEATASMPTAAGSSQQDDGGDPDEYSHSVIERMERYIQKAHQHRPVQQQDQDDAEMTDQHEQHLRAQGVHERVPNKEAPACGVEQLVQQIFQLQERLTYSCKTNEPRVKLRINSPTCDQRVTTVLAQHQGP